MIVINSYGFKLFGKEIPYYGILFILGFTIAVIISLYNTKKLNIKKSEVTYAGIFAGIGGIIGAKLFSIVTSIKYIIKYDLSLVQIMQNGFVFYGGLIGGILGLFIYCKAYKLSFHDYCELFAPGLPLGHALGRIGCLFSGCCFGVEVNSGFSVMYKISHNPNTPLNTLLLPVQLIESICLVLIFVACEIEVLKVPQKKLSAYTYIFSYSIIRFILEFFRNDLERGVYILSTSQYISIVLFIGAMVCFVLDMKNRCNSKKNTKIE